MTATTSAIIEKIDELLEDDKNFTTRTGLRFMTSVMKEALQVIGEVAGNKQSFDTRLSNIEKGLNDFLVLQEKKEKRADEERTKWRWAIIAPLIGILFTEIARFVFR